MKTDGKYLNQRAMAKELGISVVALQKWRREKGCPAKAEGKQVLYDVAIVKEWAKVYRENKHGLTPEYTNARAKREEFLAKLEELKYLEKSGELLPVAQIKKEAETLYRRYRDQMLNVAIRASKKLLGEVNERRFKKILAEEIKLATKREYITINGKKL